MPIPVLSGISDALDWYQRNIGDTVSGTLLQGANKLKMGLGLGDEGSQTLDSLDPRSAMNFAFRDNPWGRFAYSTATDPLNLVGAGIPEHILASGLVKGIPMLDHGLQALDAMGAARNAGMTALGHTAGSVAGDVAYPLAAKAGPIIDQFGASHPDIAGGWQTATGMWKDLAHLPLAWDIRNAVDDSSRAALMGEPGSAAESLRSMLPDRWGSKWANPAQPLADEFMGGKLPESVTSAGIPMSGPGNWAGKMGPFGDAVQKLVDTKKSLMEGGEVRLRSPLYTNTFNDAIQAPLQGMLGNLRGKGYGLTADELEHSGGVMSGSSLANDLMLRHGAPSASAMSLGDLWKTVSEDALRQADDRTNQVYFKYSGDPWHDAASKLDPAVAQAVLNSASHLAGPMGMSEKGFIKSLGPNDIDLLSGHMAGQADMWPKLHTNAAGQEVLQGLAANTFGGYRFATQMLPAAAGMAVSHPAMANIPEQYYRDSDLYNFTHGGGSGYHGMMPAGTVPDWVPLLGGQQVRLDPMQASSLGMLVGAASDRSNDEDVSPLGEAAQTASDIGFGLNPLVRAGLTASGQFGSKQMSDVIRPLAPVSAIAGAALGRPVDLEGPIKGAVSDAEQALTGRETTPYQDYLVRQRQVEDAGGRSTAAMDTGAVQAQARREVSNQLLGSDLFNNLLGVPNVKFQNPENAGIQQANTQARLAGQLSHNPAVAQGTPTMSSYDFVDPLKAKVAMFSTLPFDQQVAMMRDPALRDLILQQRAKDMHASPAFR